MGCEPDKYLDIMNRCKHCQSICPDNRNWDQCRDKCQEYYQKLHKLTPAHTLSSRSPAEVRPTAQPSRTLIVAVGIPGIILLLIMITLVLFLWKKPRRPRVRNHGREVARPLEIPHDGLNANPENRENDNLIERSYRSAPIAGAESVTDVLDDTSPYTGVEDTGVPPPNLQSAYLEQKLSRFADDNDDITEGTPLENTPGDSDVTNRSSSDRSPLNNERLPLDPVSASIESHLSERAAQSTNNTYPSDSDIHDCSNSTTIPKFVAEGGAQAHPKTVPTSEQLGSERDTLNQHTTPDVGATGGVQEDSDMQLNLTGPTRADQISGSIPLDPNEQVPPSEGTDSQLSNHQRTIGTDSSHDAETDVFSLEHSVASQPSIVSALPSHTDCSPSELGIFCRQISQSSALSHESQGQSK